jgi:O-methyltransferase
MSIRSQLKRIKPLFYVYKVLRYQVLTPPELRSIPPYMYYGHHKKIKIDQDIDVFSETAQLVIGEGRTLLWEDRLYTLYQMIRDLEAEQLVVEVGVYKGGSTKFISTALRKLNKNNQVISCDTFAGHASVRLDLDGKHDTKIAFKDTSAAEVRNYLRGCPNIEIVEGDINETYRQIQRDKEIGLLHLDVDVYQATKFVLDTFAPRMSRRGVIVCDDYGFTSCKGAKVAVDEFAALNTEWRVIHLLTGQAILLKG